MCIPYLVYSVLRPSIRVPITLIRVNWSPVYRRCINIYSGVLGDNGNYTFGTVLFITKSLNLFSVQIFTMASTPKKRNIVGIVIMHVFKTTKTKKWLRRLTIRKKYKKLSQKYDIGVTIVSNILRVHKFEEDILVSWAM